MTQNKPDFESITLKLRSEIIVRPMNNGREVIYVVEDRLKSKFYRIGATEYQLVSMFDGSTKLGTAIELLNSLEPKSEWTLQRAVGVCQWMLELELADLASGSNPSVFAKRAERTGKKDNWKKINPLIFDIPLAHPDGFFTRLTPLVSWLFSPLAMFAWLVLCVVSCGYVFANSAKLLASSHGILAPNNWLWLAVAWLVLKSLHELAHGIVCKRYGAEVGQIGIVMILFAPIAYMNVTSTWRLSSKWQRIHVAIAGMYAELAIAFVAGIVWSCADPGVLSHLCFNVMLMASLSTVLFNANPLLRFDGYYVLSDLIGVPNLYTVAQQYWNYAVRRYLLGIKSSLPVMTPGRGLFIRVYAVASWAWRVTICISLVVGASVLFHGAGMLLAIGAVVAWVAPWLMRTVAQLTNRAAPVSWLRFGTLLTAMGVTIAAAFWCNWPMAHRATGIVQYAEVAQVRAPVAGFVDELFVTDGQVLEAGVPIARLRNEKLEAELADLKLAETQSTIRMRVYERTKELAKAAEEEEVLQSLRHRITTTSQQVDELTIRAVEGGRVMRKNLEAVVGVYAREGDLIAAIVHDDSKELILTVAQDDVEHLSAEANRSIQFLPAGRSMVTCELTQVDPRASTLPIHDALCSSNGGSLAVRSTVDAEGTKIELLKPHFKGVATIPLELNEELLVGHRGTVYIENQSHSVAFHLYRRFSAWIELMAGQTEV